MSKATLRAILVFALMGSSVYGACLDPCVDTKYFSYDSVQYMGHDSSSYLDDVARTLYEDDFGYQTFIYESRSDLSSTSPPYNTTTFLEELECINAAAIVAHGNENYIQVEYYDTVLKVMNSAEEQGFWTESDGWGFGYYPSQVLNGDGTHQAYCLSVDIGVISAEIPDYGVVTMFFHFACNGSGQNGLAYQAGAASGGYYGYLSFDGPTNASGFESFESVILALDCPYDDDDDGPFYTRYKDVVEDPTCPGFPFAFDDIQGLNADLVEVHPCIGCINEASSGLNQNCFGNAGVSERTAFWYLRRQVAIDGFKVFGRQGGGWELCSQTEQRNADTHKWFDRFSCELSGDYSEYYIEAILSNGTTSQSQVFSSQPAGTPPHQVGASDGPLLLTYPDTGEFDVLIAYQSHDGTHQFDANSINTLISFYSNQGMSVGTVTDNAQAISTSYINSFYSLNFSAADPALLVLCGPTLNGGHALSVGGEYISDDQNGCQNIFGCYSDWVVTDINGDDIPDGPMTRIPVWNSAQLIDWVNKANSFNQGENLAPFRQVGFICGDAENASKYSEMVDISVQYSSSGYVSKTIIRESQLPTNGGWPIFVSQANEGLLEFWVNGTRTGQNLWTYAMKGGSFFDNYAPQLSREQGMIFWAATCQTGLQYLGPDGTLYGGSLGLQFFDNPTTHAVALIGHSNGGWDTQHEKMRSYLLEGRLNAIPGETTVSDVALYAIRRFIDDFPWLKSHALGLSAWGCNVTIQYPEYSAAPPSQGENDLSVRILYNGSSQIQLDIASNKERSLVVEIFDIKGRRIKTLVETQIFSPGKNLTWNGRDKNGRTVPSGVYFFKIKMDSDVILKKAVLVK